MSVFFRTRLGLILILQKSSSAWESHTRFLISNWVADGWGSKKVAEK